MGVTIIIYIYILFLFVWSIKRSCVIFDLRNFLFDADQNAPPLSIDLLKTYVIIFHRDKQLCWRFYTSNQKCFKHWDRQLSWRFMFLNEWRHFHIENGKFPDDFVLNKIRSFYRVDIWHLPGILKKKNNDNNNNKRTVPIDEALFPWSETTKNLKNCQKSTRTTIPRRRRGVDFFSCFLFSFFFSKLSF